MRLICTICFLILISSWLVSCKEVKKETIETYQEAKDQFKSKIKEGLNQAFPQFDAYEADTENNKARFKEFLQVEISPDIKNIYCHADEMGIDASYQFGFHCNRHTVSKILEQHELQPNLETQTLDSRGVEDSFSWWDPSVVATLPKYTWEGENNFYKYFWYDSTAQSAYYLEFDF